MILFSEQNINNVLITSPIHFQKMCTQKNVYTVTALKFFNVNLHTSIIVSKLGTFTGYIDLTWILI